MAENGASRVLAVSTDPAHSLGDAFAARLSGEPRSIATRRGMLLAAELDVARALERWLRQHRETLRQIAERGTYLDDQDVDRLLGLSLPGADELVGFLDLARLSRQSRVDLVVVDTAPTAHTLRLLQVPGLLRRFAGALDGLGERHRVLAESFGGAHRTDRADELVDELEEDGRELEELLRDPARSSFTWVLLPEALAIAETRDALAALDEAGIPVSEVIVNRVTPPRSDACPLCRERRRAEMAAIEEIQTAFGHRGLRFLPAFDREPRGRPALRKVAKALADPSLRPSRAVEPSPAKRRRDGEGVPAWLDTLAPPGVRLLLFGGKGGVGKTTCSAATALALAAGRPGQRVLLLSTDPAHSLADVLGTSLGDDERPVPHAPSGLRARELDATATFAAWRGRHQDELGSALGSLGGDKAVERLLEIAPPGLDELVALSTILEAVLEEGGPDVVVVDTAPTGHALRLLEAPELALEWDRALLAILLKYREAVGLGRLAAELVELSKSLKRLIALLQDPARARFVAVTRAAELPRRETVRLLAELRRLSIEVPAVIVNAVSDCACSGVDTSRTEAARLRKACKACAIMTAPAVFPPPSGAEALAGWLKTWKQDTG
jgi:arsenite-transporting ATPase